MSVEGLKMAGMLLFWVVVASCIVCILCSDTDDDLLA